MARSTRLRSPAPTPAQQVSVWEDDPEPGVRATRPLPDPAGAHDDQVRVLDDPLIERPTRNRRI